MIPEKRLLVLVNPFGGQSKAKAIYEDKVKAVFEAAKCSIEVKCKQASIITKKELLTELILDTQHQNHALEIARDLDIQSYDAIVTVSGDGLIHEVLNGFLQRSDAREAIKRVSLGIIPAGTSNSLSISMSGEKLGFDHVHNALQVIKGRPLGMDICSVTCDDRHYYSFLSHSFGIAAYADLGTEHMRYIP